MAARLVWDQEVESSSLSAPIASFVESLAGGEPHERSGGAGETDQGELQGELNERRHRRMVPASDRFCPPEPVRYTAASVRSAGRRPSPPRSGAPEQAPRILSATMVSFKKRVLFVGFGAVARCTLPILLDHIKVDPRNITILDFEPNESAIRPWTEKGVTFVRDKVTPDNLGTLLGRHLAAGDLLIDLAWNIDCCEIVQWCHDHGVLYLNTSVEIGRAHV